jgi:hypothetical protein
MMVVIIDIDDTICTSSEDLDYSKSIPLKEKIKKANKLYDDGHTVIYWTARGRETGIDWREVTEAQFEGWGVKYHELRFNKPYDLIIDDKAINAEDW